MLMRAAVYIQPLHKSVKDGQPVVRVCEGAGGFIYGLIFEGFTFIGGMRLPNTMRS
jgi:hypothetical protein